MNFFGRLMCAALAVAVVTGTAFAGGGREKVDDGTVKLEIFHYLDLADNTEAENFQAVVRAFQEKHPEIKLEFDYLFDEAYHNRLQAMAVAQQLPDVLFLWPDKRTGHVTGSGLIKDLRPWIEPVRDQFAPAALAPQGPNGEIWELPEQITTTHVMYTNDRLLKELGLTFPETLEELIAQGEVIRAAGYIPIAMDNGGGWQMQSTLLSTLVERTGGREWIERAAAGRGAAFTDPQFVRALEVIQILFQEEMFSPGLNQAEYGQAMTAFANDRAVYFIDGGWRTRNLATELTPEQQKTTSYNVFPRLPDEQGQPGATSIVPGTGHGMNANLTGEKAEAAWTWIYFFAGPEGSRIKAEQGWVPAVVGILDDSAPLMTRKLADFLAATPGGYVIDSIMDAEGMAVLQPALQEMMFGAISPQEVARRYENWVAANDSSRR
ncbi:ABC transporter substrate-binding protein [Alkalispirochaeta alkalica]|uniref:ABC transporter substrate-binding protein n=1 Tax=Alkalispirochaeta alkalica TaxID=46356 RepID=UPI000360880C|nr:ABC transporter substrate-binding protein [Alkalispirochaeta alkalica]